MRVDPAPMRIVHHEHDHVHAHRHRHGQDCHCHGCRYDGTLNDLVRFKQAVELIGRGGDPGASLGSGETTAPANEVSAKTERIRDELDNFNFHNGGGFSRYA